MKTPGLALVAAIVAAMTLVMAFDAVAQFGGGMGRRGMRMEKGNSSSSRSTTQESVTSLVDYRLALLQEDLKLTREQESGWLTYEERIKALAGDIARERERAKSASAAISNAVEQANHAVDMARNRLAAWEEIAAATKGLYDILNPQQKSLADQRFASIVQDLSGMPVPGAAPGPSSLASPTRSKDE
jgi:hypothetical protein